MQQKTQRNNSRAPGAQRHDGRSIVSYPKSGRTWLRFALEKAGVEATFTHAGTATHRKEIGLQFRGIPSAMLDVPLVFLHRDPIDTAVSMYYQITRRDFRRGTGRWLRLWLPLALRRALPPVDIDDFVLHPIYGVEKLCRFNRAWLDHIAGRHDCLVLTYEEMRRDPAGGFQRLLDFWGERSVTGAQLAALSSFEKMKAAEKADSAPAVLRRTVSDDASSAKMRKGKVRGYLDELRPETIAECRAIAAKYGFDTP